MKFGDIVQYPHFSKIVYEIEKTIYSWDKYSQSQQVTWKDSDVKSALRKIMGLAKGPMPSLPEKSEKDKLFKKLILELLDLGAGLKTLKSEKTVSERDWIVSLKVVEDSLKTRREMYGHSRGYLEFLEDFLTKGKIV